MYYSYLETTFHELGPDCHGAIQKDVLIDFEINIVSKPYHNRKIGKGYE